jgi:hypothetical protein
MEPFLIDPPRGRLFLQTPWATHGFLYPGRITHKLLSKM